MKEIEEGTRRRQGSREGVSMKEIEEGTRRETGVM
jgi:hypothetical protein